MRDWLIEKRKEKQYTQLKVSKESGISRNYYTQIENGVRNPSVSCAKRIAEVLEVSWTQFYE